MQHSGQRPLKEWETDQNMFSNDTPNTKLCVCCEGRAWNALHAKRTARALPPLRTSFWHRLPWSSLESPARGFGLLSGLSAYLFLSSERGWTRFTLDCFRERLRRLDWIYATNIFAPSDEALEQVWWTGCTHPSAKILRSSLMEDVQEVHEIDPGERV